jgi:hypothetical protein
MMSLFARLFPIQTSSVLNADCLTPHPPFGHLLPQGEKAMEPRVWQSGLLLPLWEKVARAQRETDEGSISRHGAAS